MIKYTKAEKILSLKPKYKVFFCLIFLAISCKGQEVKIKKEEDTAQKELLNNLRTPLNKNLIYSQSVSLIRNSVIQSFDVDSKGTIFYDQLGGALAHVVFTMRALPNQPVFDNMQFKYIGHGTNMAIEESDNDRYIWINSIGTKKSDGSYGSNLTFSRVKYVPGSIIEHYGGETYYLPGKTNIHPAIDQKNDLLAVTTSGAGQPRSFYIYRLSEARKLPETTITMPSVKFGGEEKDVPEQTIRHTLKIKDLSKLTPLASFDIKPKTTANELNYYAFQGFDIAGENIYFYEGEGNGNKIENGPSNAFVTILDYKGNITSNRTKVEAISNIENLKHHDITDTGYMEAEGIKVKNGILYLGFASRGTDDKRKANIFWYK